MKVLFCLEEDEDEALVLRLFNKALALLGGEAMIAYVICHLFGDCGY